MSHPQRCLHASGRALRPLLLLLLLSPAVSGCVVIDRRPVHVHTAKSHEHDPPHHAPAHGHRHKHHAHGVEMVFDPGIEIFVVLGHDHLYFDGGRFLRHRKGHWYVSSELEAEWRVVSADEVPKKLRKRYKRGHGEHHGSFPAAHDD
ncbi:MAG: hypothetical protein ACE5FG_01215 [Myxococcota bacterium]